MNSNKQIAINLVASAVAFVVNLGISFILTPYIVKTVGVEAYGFVSLAANFINYASLVTIALNSMAGRFITIEIYRSNWGNANKYISSVTIANIIIAGAMVIPSVACVSYIDKIVHVPSNIITDVRFLFAFLFANFLISVVASSFSVATFATNKLHLQSLRGIEASVIRAVLLIVFYVYFEPKVSFIGFAAFIVILYTTFFNLYYTKNLLPDLKISKEYFSFTAVKELTSSGIWNTILRIGQILADGVDLLIANLFISPTSMGVLALAKTVPSIISSIIATIAGVFVPDFTILFAQNKSEELLISIKRSMKLLGIVGNIPVAILAAFGTEFFRLWVPTQDAKLLQMLSIITVAAFIITGSINSLYGVLTVTNKVKVNSMLVLLTGTLNIIIVFILLKTTDLGLFAVAGVSTVLSILRNLVFTVPFGAKYLGLKWYTFFPEVIKGLIAFAIITVIGVCINYFLNINNWPLLFIAAVITSIIGLAVNLFVILERSEREYVTSIIMRKILSN